MRHIWACRVGISFRVRYKDMALARCLVSKTEYYGFKRLLCIVVDLLEVNVSPFSRIGYCKGYCGSVCVLTFNKGVDLGICRIHNSLSPDCCSFDLFVSHLYAWRCSLISCWRLYLTDCEGSLRETFGSVYSVIKCIAAVSQFCGFRDWIWIIQICFWYYPISIRICSRIKCPVRICRKSVLRVKSFIELYLKYCSGQCHRRCRRCVCICF